MRIACLVLFCATTLAAATYPDQEYPRRELFQPISTIDRYNGLLPADGRNSVKTMGAVQVLFHRGHMLVPFARNAATYGSGSRLNGMAVFDLSDPYDPRRVFMRQDEQTNEIREAHGHVLSSGDLWCINTIKGVQFWDISNAANPRLVSDMQFLKGGSTYGNTGWWVMGQHPYYYLGATQTGLSIIKADDPANPQLVKHIDNSFFGMTRGGSVHCIGNYLILGQAGDDQRFCVADISDPENPVVLDTVTNAAGDYSVGVYGEWITSMGYGDHGETTIQLWDWSDPTNVVKINERAPANHGGLYAAYQDGYFHAPMFPTYDKYTLPDLELVGQTPEGPIAKTYEFTNVLGNLIVGAGGGDGAGLRLVPHQSERDTTPPEVNFVSPKPGMTNQAVTSRIGVMLTDVIDFTTVSTNTFRVRKQGDGGSIGGYFSFHRNYLNFTPAVPLEDGTTYEISIRAGGITDLMGNGIKGFTSTFTTDGEGPVEPLVITNNDPAPAQVGTLNWTMTTSGGAGDLEYAFEVSRPDGSTDPRTRWSDSPDYSLTVSEPGHYQVLLRARDEQGTVSKIIRQIVHLPLADRQPVNSSPIILSADGSRVWNVNPDNNSVTAIRADALTRTWIAPVGADPRCLAEASDGTLWVTAYDADRIDIISGEDGAEVARIALPYGAAPHGIVMNDNRNVAYVALEGRGEVWRFDVINRVATGDLAVGPKPRGLARTGNRLFVNRFISPQDVGQVHEVDLASLSLVRTIPLQISTHPDTIDSGRGIPNYLGHPALSPDGTRLLIPAKQDNIQRGLIRDGRASDPENIVRTIVAAIDLTNNTEDYLRRRDMNDADLAQAMAFSEYGTLAFVALQGINAVGVMDVYGNTEFLRFSVESAPQGLVLDADRGRLFVHNFLSRTVSVIDVSGTLQLDGDTPAVLDAIRVVRNRDEVLADNVLTGKRLFYHAGDPRMSTNGYLSCATCHLDGGQDGRVLDITERGEGLRNTISLHGGRGTGHGRVHWTANFDEIQDFEHDIRSAFGGLGFMADGDFNTGTRNTTLGDPKAGVSAELDALAAYVTSLDTLPKSPYRNADGSLTSDAIDGRDIFKRLDCATCHSDADFTDSLAGLLHDVGTLTGNSGERLGEPLSGIDTPTLLGLWSTAPYLHDGSAATVRDVIDRGGAAHGAMADLRAGEKRKLEAYLLQLDGSSTNPGIAEMVRLIMMRIIDGSVWSIDVDAKEVGTETTQTFSELDPTRDHVLEALPVGNN